MLLIASALSSVLAGGCASRLVQHGGPASRGVPAAGSAERVEPSRARAAKTHANDVSHDPLGEANARAVAQPNEPWWPYRAAQLEASKGHRDAAEKSFRTALSCDPAYAPALAQLSRMLYEQGRHEEAIRLLTPVAEQRIPLAAADRAALLAGLALHEAALGRDDRARGTMAVLARGERDDARGVAAYLAVRGSSADSAVKLTQAALEAAPESAANHNNRGIALLRAGDPEAAAPEFERAIALDPARSGPWYNLAILERWYRLDPAAASRRFQQYWTRSHADPDSLFAELGHGFTPPVASEEPKP